jgi:surface polysaccharide O-acyltransferase-like enzyme
MPPAHRDSGVDAAKILAIVLVIVHHTVDFGFVLPETAGGALKFLWHAVRTVSISCIDLFALVTGYLCIRSDGSLKRLPALWLQAVATGAAVSVLCLLAGARPTAYEWLRTFLPVTTGEYWYFTAYFLLCLAMPLVNPGVRGMEKKSLLRLLAALFLFVSVPSVLFPGDPFVLRHGYSFAWLLAVYLFGAYWRLHAAAPPRVSVCLGVLGLCAVSFLIPSAGKRLFGGPAGDWFSSFNPVYPSSPFVLAIALALFGFCRRIRTGSDRAGRLPAALAGLSFGMYLWLVHPVFWRAFWRPLLGTVVVSSIPDFLGKLSGVVAAAFVLAGLLEGGRQRLFRTVSGRLSRRRETP